MNLQELQLTFTDLSKYVDVEDGLNRIQKNKKLYDMILRSFVKNTYYEELYNHLKENDIISAEHSAHTMKGVAANLSLPLVYELSASLDVKLKEGNVGDEMELQELGEAIDKTLEYIDVVLQNLDDIDI